MAHTEKRDYLCNYDDDDDFESPAPFPNGDVDSQGSIHCQCVNTCVRHDSQRIFSYRVELDEEDEHYGVDSRHTDWFLSQCANCKLVKICQCVVTRVEADLFVSMTSGVSFDEFMRVLKNNAQNQPDAEARATATLHSLYFGHPFPANFVPPTVWQGRDLAVANEKRMVVFELLGTQEQRQRFSDWIRDVYFAEPSGLRPGYAVSAAHSPKNSFGYHYGTAAAVEAVVVGSWNVPCN
jgi:hypothetical protein